MVIDQFQGFSKSDHNIPHPQVSIFLQKAKECLLAAQARFDVELTTPSLVYYPDLSNRILDLLTEVEVKMDEVEGKRKIF